MDSEQLPGGQDKDIKSGPTSAHMSALGSVLSRPFEVITRSERRRWSIEQKREIIAEGLEAGARPSEVMRKHGISSSQLYSWRRQLTRRLDGKSGGQPTNFARVDLVTGAPRAESVIEIVLPDGTSVRVDGRVEDRALRCVLGALRDR
jgi:transposase